MDRSEATFKKYSSQGVDWAAWFLGIGLGLTLALQVTTMRWSDISSVYSAIASRCGAWGVGPLITAR
jgi:hypothetical protein